ncbi:MAG: DUF4142 domain-containing protein [Gemmatimonadota bacterium]
MVAKIRVTAVALLLLAAAACGSGDEAGDTAADSVEGAQNAEAAAGQLSPVRSVSLAMIEFGDVATTSATRTDVRQYGVTVATDHRGVVQALDSLARARSLSQTETVAAKELSDAVRLAHAGLEGPASAAFDLAYIRAQVESHRQLLDRLEVELIPTSRDDVRQLLADVQAMEMAHLTRARQLLAGLLGQPAEPPRSSPGAERPTTVRTDTTAR